MQCTEQTILINPACVVCECCTPGHIIMARCIRLLCGAPMYDTSQMIDTDTC